MVEPRPEGSTDPLDRRATLGLAALASAVAALAIAEPGTAPGVALAGAAAGFAALFGAAALVRAVAARRGRFPRETAEAAGIALLLACFGLPFAAAGVRLAAGWRSDPLEVVLLAALRNLGLALAVLADRPRYARPAAVVSLFLILVASGVADAPAVLGLLVAYAVAGGSWLAAAHWRGLRLPAAGRSEAGRPWAGAALAVGLVLAAAGLVAAGPSRAASALAGLVPSSGGTDWDDPEARGGVGDGEHEVQGSEKPESIGFTESDIYLESDRPALYDAFSDMYGEPIKPRKMDRMIALANPDIQEQERRAAENLRAGRQFAAVRRKPMGPARRPGDRDARALVYVKGPAPLHLGLATYDRFDGRSWSEEPACARAFPFTVDPGGADPWFRRDQGRLAHLASTPVRHQIKVGTLDSSPMPLPAHLDRFRIGRVNRQEFFGWAQDGVVRMAGRTVPSGTVIETDARVADPRRLRDLRFPAGKFPAVQPGGYRPDAAVKALAWKWAGDLPRGWSQVEAVVARVREHAGHDRGEVVPPGCDDVVAHFLFRARRGPDYLFASAASALLRELGYSTRMVSGLYADPGRYDARTRHVPVAEGDVHTWVEVRLPDGDWTAVEPTPGYAVLLPEPGWADRFWAALGHAGDWARRHAPALAAGLVLALILVALRRRVADLAATLAWRAALAFDPSRGAVRTLHLVDARARRAGLPRPTGRTPGRWYGGLARDHAIPAGADLAALLALAERHLYAPGGPTEDPSDLCRRVAGGWTFPTFRNLARAAGRPHEAIA